MRGWIKQREFSAQIRFEFAKDTNGNKLRHSWKKIMPLNLVDLTYEVLYGISKLTQFLLIIYDITIRLNTKSGFGI